MPGAAPHPALLAQHSFDPEALWGSAETLQAAVRRTLAGARGKACPPSGGGDAATDCAPVFVFINGLFDGGVAGPVRKHLRRTFPACRFISLHCGAVSSVRDRAVECFWELRGGRVDYQVDGAVLEHGHSRFGEEHPGLLPSWGADSPIHIFAFSLGATTARCLQHLLERGVFADKHGPIATSGAWIKTIVTLHGANSGSLAVHYIGLSPWSLTPLPLSILWWIFTIIYCIVWLDDDKLNRCSGLRLRHWKAQRRKSAEDAGGISLARLQLWRPGASDNAGRDLAPRRMEELNAVFAQTLPHPATRYIAAYGTVFAPVCCHVQGEGCWRYFGLHLPRRGLFSRFPYVVFLLPFGVMQSLVGLLSRVLDYFVLAAQEAEEASGSADKLGGKDMKARTHQREEAQREDIARSCSVCSLRQKNVCGGSVSPDGDDASFCLEPASGDTAEDTGVVDARSSSVREVGKMFERSPMQERAAAHRHTGAQPRVSSMAPCATKTEKNVKAKQWRPNRTDWRTHLSSSDDGSKSTYGAQSWLGVSPLPWVMSHVSGARGVAKKMRECVVRSGRLSTASQASMSHRAPWHDDEANDGVISVAAQKAPATEWGAEPPREFESVASLLAAQRQQGPAVVPLGAWTNVFAGWHDHIELMEDGEEQRALMQGLCSLICESR